MDLPLREPVSLEKLTWPAIRTLQESGPALLLFPLGATEQHGPHLPVNTDSVIARRLCEFTSAQLGVPLLPPLQFTQSTGHTAQWPGTFSLSHATFAETLVELVSWAVSTGWRRVLFVNAHFGNDAALRVAVDRLRIQFLGRCQVGFRHTFHLTPAIWEYFTSDGDDIHANRAETDLMLHLAPGDVDMDAVADDPDRTPGTVFSYPVAQTSLNGVTGSPSLGTAARGRELFEEMGRALTEIVQAALTENPPLPQEHWQHLITPSSHARID